jgi:hypothetical protein
MRPVYSVAVVERLLGPLKKRSVTAGLVAVALRMDAEEANFPGRSS